MRKTIIFLVIGVFVLFSSVGMAEDWKPEKKFLKIATGPEGGSWYPLGAGIMRAVEDNIKGISASAGPGGGVVNNKSVNRWKADLGVTFSATAFDAYNGHLPFRDKLNKLRYIASFFPGILQVAVPIRSNIHSFSDLADKNIVAGRIGTFGEVVIKSVLEAYGITFDSIKKKGGVIQHVGYSDAASLMKDRRVSAIQFFTVCPQSTIMDLNFRPGIRFLPIDKEHMKKIIAKHPGYFQAVIPKEAYKGMVEDVPTLSTVTCLICNAGLSDEMVYRITKIVWENRDEIVKIKPKGFSQMNLENALLGCKIPIHPGAKRYYDEQGVK